MLHFENDNEEPKCEEQQRVHHETANRRCTKGTLAATKESYDWHGCQDPSLSSPSRILNTMQRTSLKPNYTLKEESQDPHETRRGRCGGQGHRASKTTASIFAPPTPRCEPPLDAELLHKVEHQKPLTNDERTAALYHPRLFQQPRTALSTNINTPWNVTRQDPQYRATRKMKTQEPIIRPPQTDAEELFNESGKKKLGYSTNANLETSLTPTKRVFIPSRKHVIPTAITENDEQRRLVKKHVDSMHVPTVDLKIDDYPNEERLKERFHKKRVEMVHGDSITSLAADHQPIAAPLDTGKFLTHAQPGEDGYVAHKKGYYTRSSSTAPDSTKCPFGTDYSFELYKVRATGMMTPSYETFDAPHRVTGLAMPSNRPKDQINMLTWNE
jgi:hypothetical protein